MIDKAMRRHSTSRASGKQERKMGISYYDRTIKPHLIAAREYAYRTAARSIECQRGPASSRCPGRTRRAEQAAEELLQTIRDARREYDSKPVEREHAA